MVTYKTYDDYFTDFGVPTNKDSFAGTTITGDGSKQNPFTINSTSDFYYITNYYIDGKYISINCDIILNDEFFDKEGNPSGGDGVIYNWSPRVLYGWQTSILGNGHTIYGFYCDENTALMAGIFHNMTLNVVRDLNFENVFVKDEENSFFGLIARKIKTLENCKIKSGTIKGKGYIGGFCSTIIGQANNCENYATLYASEARCGGIASCVETANSKVTNCKNFGDIYGYSYVGGIVGYTDQSAISNSENYAQIYGENFTAGGVVGGVNSTKLSSCLNYGQVFAKQGNIGGIVGFVGTATMFDNCSNFGFVEKGIYLSVGQIMGCSISYSTKIDNLIFLRNCKAKSSCGKPLVGQVQTNASRIVDLRIENCEMTFENLEEGLTSPILYSSNNATNKVSIDNVVINYVGRNFTSPLINTANGQCKIKNVLYKINCEAVGINNFISKSGEKSNLYCDGIIVEINGGATSKKSYYGSDFSGFYTDWKTGKIGLKALSGKGFYQGNVTEELLKQKGFVRKAI